MLKLLIIMFTLLLVIKYDRDEQRRCPTIRTGGIEEITCRDPWRTSARGSYCIAQTCVHVLSAACLNR